MEILNKIQKELSVPKGQLNKFGGYKYRSCEDILEAVKPLLGDACLIINDEVVDVAGRVYVKATALLKYKDQEVSVSAYAREAETKKGMDEAQITGSASSYARKYALNGLFCIDDTKDADATNNHGKDDPIVIKQKELIKLLGDDVNLANEIKAKLKYTKMTSEMNEAELDAMINEAKQIK